MRLFSNVNSKGEDISDGAAAIWMGRRPWRGGGGIRRFDCGGEGCVAFSQDLVPCTFLVFLCEKPDKLLPSCYNLLER